MSRLMKSSAIAKFMEVVGAEEKTNAVLRQPDGSAVEYDVSSENITLILDAMNVLDEEVEIKFYAANRNHDAHKFIIPPKRRLTKEELKDIELKESLSNAVMDHMTMRMTIRTEKGTLLNNLLLGKKKQTLSMFQVPVAYFTRPTKDGPFKKKLKFIKLAESRLTRFFESNLTTEQRKRELKLNNGEMFNAFAEYTYYELVGCPIVFMEYVGKPLFNDMEQIKTYEECKEIIFNGLNWKYKGESIMSEYCQSSASEMRTLKGVHVRSDFKFSDEYLANFGPADDSEEEKDAYENFMTLMRSLRGAEVIYTAMSYGAYLVQYKGLKESPAKFMARMGMAQTSTKSLGNAYTVKHIGEVKIKWTDEIENEYTQFFTGLVDESGNRMYSDKRVENTVAKIKKYWKEEKMDGQNMIRASAVIRGFLELGIKLKIEDVVGKLIQFRWAGVKGTAFVVPDEMLDVCTLPDGSHPYMGYDIIVEHSSWKYTPWLKFWNGKLAPELELVAISKTKYSNNMNYQFFLALDGDGNRKVKTVEKLFELIDMKYVFATQALTNADLMKAYLGLKANKDVDVDELLDIDEYDKTLTTVLAKALDADDSVIFDRSWRMKFINRLTKMRDKMGFGKIPVEGANRFVISDPTPMLRTDLAIPRMKDGKPVLDHEGNPMFDIEITSMSQVAVQGITNCYWNNTNNEAVLFRSPCVHPGEPQRVSLVDLEGDSILEGITTAYGRINVRELFGYMKDLVVVNVFSSILDTLGGADTDGDTVLVVTEPIVVMLRSLKRAPMLTKVDDGTLKTVISPASVKEYMANSLEDAGIGRVTNYATTWRDIELMVIHMPDPVSKKHRLPSGVKTALLELAKEAREALKLRGSKMDEDEAASAEATAALKDINVDEKWAEWSNAVVNACEANMMLLRKLQESAINTAKSGKFIEFSRYPWIKLKIRATWHRPYAKCEKYDSWSTMGQVNTYADAKWKELREWAGENAKPIDLGFDIDWASYREVYKRIRELKASYGTQIYLLNRPKDDYDEDTEEQSEKERMDAYKLLSWEFNKELRNIAVEIGSIDAVSAMVYRATNDRDKDTDEGLSFVWQCWGSEFVHTLKHANGGKASKRLVAVHMDKEYASYTLSEGEYLVENNEVKSMQYPDVVLGYAKVEDGFYEIITFDEMPYLLKHITKKKVDSMAATFKGVKFRLIGFKYWSYEGETLTRNKVKELIAANNYTVTVQGSESGRMEDGMPHIDAMVFVNDPNGGESICIGNIPSGGAKSDETGFFAQALHDKEIRLLIPKDADKVDVNRHGEANRLTLEILDITRDLALEE